MRPKSALGALLFGLASFAWAQHGDRPATQKSEDRIAKEVRHELVMLPYYSVFDNLAYRIDGTRVSLFGQVVRPTLKSDAEKVVKKVEGVTGVTNEIEVLPASPNDDRLR